MAMTPITDVCGVTMERILADTAGYEDTLARLAYFTQHLNALFLKLDGLGQVALADLAAEYTVAVITAERLELAAGAMGDVVEFGPKPGDGARQHLALVQAGALRSRMRQIHKEIARLAAQARLAEHARPAKAITCSPRRGWRLGASPTGDTSTRSRTWPTWAGTRTA